MLDPLNDLIDRLATRPFDVLVVAGTGISIATTRNQAVSSWKGLLEHGIQYCLGHCSVSEKWARVRRDQLGIGEFVEVASEVAARLGAPDSGVYAGWLQETIGKLNAIETDAIRALDAWGCPIATTNYDTLITQVINREPITGWDQPWLNQFFNGETQHILHLHGVWTKPKTVVLSARNYEDILRDQGIQDSMKALLFGKSLVFVGCGPSGLADPNIGKWMLWYREVMRKMIRPSYLLACSSDKEMWRAITDGTQIRIVPYGDAHAALPGFLEQIANQVNQLRTPDRPLNDLIRAQPTFDQKLKEIRARTGELGTAEVIRRLMDVVRSHWQLGGRRSAWMAVSRSFRHEGKSLQVEERLRFGLELADMMLIDEMPDWAFDLLTELLPDVEADEIGSDQRYHYWNLRAHCVQGIGPYADTRIALERAIAMAPCEMDQLKLEAELDEILFLQGEVNIINPGCAVEASEG